jgi:hypothetical protein
MSETAMFRRVANIVIKTGFSKLVIIVPKSGLILYCIGSKYAALGAAA